LIFPVAIVIAFFSYEVILLWTQNQATAEKTHLILSILICGTALNGIMHPPYALQLAFGWTQLSFYKNIIAVILLVPLIIYTTTHYGAAGAASVWLLLNIGYIVFEIPIMHLRLLRQEMWRWYGQDFAAPLIAGLSVAGVGRFFFHGTTSSFMTLLYVLVVSIVTLGIVVISVPTMRSRFSDRLLKIKLEV
jgi:O-antigen/teichoic acid export membrane protein